MDRAPAPHATAADRLTSLDLFAATAPGLAPITAAELAALDIACGRVSSDGVEFTGDLTAVARANVWLRTASRVLVRMGSFRARTFAELERHARALDWARFLGRDARPVFRITSRKSRLFHTGAIDDRLRAIATTGAPDDAPEQLFIVRGVRDEWSVSADSSGDHLHRRGYRQAVAKAPLRETLAAALVFASEWDVESPFIDPFCGSGTIPIEAAMIAHDIPPGGGRPFAFERWADAPRGAAASVRAPGAADNVNRMPVIAGSDRDEGAIESARENAERAGVGNHVTFENSAMSGVGRPDRHGWLVTNPPYGVRLGDAGELVRLYRAFGDIARERFSGWTVALLSGEPKLDRATALPLRATLRTTNGGLPVRVMTGVVP